MSDSGHTFDSHRLDECADCGHARELHYGIEGACVSVEQPIQCGCKKFVMAVGVNGHAIGANRDSQLVEEIASFVEHLRDDYVSTAEPVAKVARLIRERFGAGGNQPSMEPAKATSASEAP